MRTFRGRAFFPLAGGLPKFGSLGLPPRMMASPTSPISTSFWLPSS